MRQNSRRLETRCSGIFVVRIKRLRVDLALVTFKCGIAQ